MSAFRTASALLTLASSSAFVGIVASCASQGDAPEAIAPLEDSGVPDTNAVVNPGPDAAALQACADGRWCSVTAPLEGAFSINGIWGSGPNDVWLVASPDVAIHFDGAGFQSTRLGSQQTVFGIWGSGPSDVWAFSTGDTLWHNGTGGNGAGAWSAVDRDASASARPGVISGMWGASSNDIWAVGPLDTTQSAPATVWHGDGWKSGAPSWIASPTTPVVNPWDTDPPFDAIWGGDGEVWIVGDKGKTRYSNGWKGDAATWTVIDSGTSLHLHAVWGARAGDVWAAGSGGVVRHFVRQGDGSIATQDVPFPSRATIRALAGFASNDIWAGGTDGTLAHWDGGTWSLVDAPVAAASDREIFALWASGPEDVWAVGRNTFFHKGSRLLPGTTP